MVRSIKNPSNYWLLGFCLLAAFWGLQQLDWVGSSQLHLLMEVAGTVLAGAVGALALLWFYTEENKLALWIGAGFLGTAFLEFFHVINSFGLGASLTDDTTADVTRSGLAPRLMLASFLLIGLWAWRDQLRDGVLSQRISVTHIYSLAIGSCVLLPLMLQPIIPARLAHIVPALIFAGALWLFLSSQTTEQAKLAPWLVLSLFIAALGEGLFMAFSSQLFDSVFLAGHALKLAGYMCLMAGIMASLSVLCKQAHQANLSAKVRPSSNARFLESDPPAAPAVTATIDAIQTPIKDDFDVSRPVLLAEDNQVNAMVAKAFIERQGLKVAWVRDGAAAVKAFERNDFAMIIMATNMSELDGVAATAKIRASKKRNGGSIPIIGLTAAAKKGNQDQLLKCGMDRVLSKPIDEQKLKAVLVDFLAFRTDKISEEEQQELIASLRQPTIVPAGPLVDEAQLQNLSDTIGADQLHLILEATAEDLQSQLNTLVGAAEVGDKTVILAQAHIVKGLAAAFYAGPLKEYAINVEQCTYDNNDYISAIKELSAVANQTIKQLKKLDKAA